MRMTVEDFIDELKKCDPKATVYFRHYASEELKQVHRVDSMGHIVQIVCESGV